LEAAKAAGGPRSAKGAAPKAAARREAATHAGGGFWVQVGAFRDEARANALVTKLRADNFKVEALGPAPAAGGTPAPAGTEGPTPLGPGDRYDVFVSGASSADVNAKLAGKGLAADPVAGGAVVKPSLPLRDAVALSKDLATEGLKVQVRRAAGAAAAERPATSGDGLYRVRIGSFSDRAGAEEARKALAAKGYNGFIARSGG
jgi:cell division septation protein DedD